MILNETTNHNSSGNIGNGDETSKSSDSAFQPDALKSRQYWQKVDSTVDGMLGGFSRINHIDIQESRKLLGEYFNLYRKVSSTHQAIDPIASGHTHSSTSPAEDSVEMRNDTSVLSENGLCKSTSSDNDSRRSGENGTSDTNGDVINAPNTSDTVSSGRASAVKRQRNKYRDVSTKDKSVSQDTYSKLRARVGDSRTEKRVQEAESRTALRRTALHSLDAGAGIGRITKNLLLSFSESVDLLEQNEAFLLKSREFIGLDERPRVGKLIASSLQSFNPTADYTYDIIWVQWVTGYLSDDELICFFCKCASSLTPNNGLIFVKDNVTSRMDFVDTDMDDSSVTRPKHLIESIFASANLHILQVRKQVKFPKGLYPVYMWVLDKRTNNCTTSSR